MFVGTYGRTDPMPPWVLVPSNLVAIGCKPLKNKGRLKFVNGEPGARLSCGYPSERQRAA